MPLDATGKRQYREGVSPEKIRDQADPPGVSSLPAGDHPYHYRLGVPHQPREERRAGGRCEVYGLHPDPGRGTRLAGLCRTAPSVGDHGAARGRTHESRSKRLLHGSIGGNGGDRVRRMAQAVSLGRR